MMEERLKQERWFCSGDLRHKSKVGLRKPHHFVDIFIYFIENT